MKELHCREFKTWIEEGTEHSLLDVREQWEHTLIKLDGSILAPINSLMANPPALDKDKPVVVYCRTGKRSLVAGHILQTMGFKNVFNLTGGIYAWSDEIDPSFPKY